MTAQPADDSSVDPSAEVPVGPQTNREARLAGIAALAQAQERVVVSAASSGRSGGRDSQIDHEIKYGRWHAPAWGVVALQNAPLTYDQRLWLGVLHAGDGAVLDSPDLVPTGRPRRGRATRTRIHVLTTKGDLVDPIEGFFFHQTRRPYGRWVRPVPSGPPRLPIEYGALLTAERDRYVRRAVGLLAACVQQRLTTADRLHRHRAADPKAPARRDLPLRCSTTSQVAPSRSLRSTSDTLCARAGLAQPNSPGGAHGQPTDDGDTWTASGSCPTVDWSSWRWTAPSTSRSATGGAT